MPLPSFRDAAAWQHLLDIAARADANEGIRQGLDDIAKNHVRPAREFFEEFEAETAFLFNISRSGRSSLH